jgi:hypothetical protein
MDVAPRVSRGGERFMTRATSQGPEAARDKAAATTAAASRIRWWSAMHLDLADHARQVIPIVICPAFGTTDSPG